jgi:hypothetical protein
MFPIVQSYVVDGRMSRGFALVAWPAQYGVTRIMTFIVDHDANVREKDLGANTHTVAQAMSVYDPDQSWVTVRR